MQATQALREGGISEVVRSGAGFHVIKVIEKRQGGLPGVDGQERRVGGVAAGGDADQGAARGEPGAVDDVPLPVEGDLLGLGGPRDFNSAAIDAGDLPTVSLADAGLATPPLPTRPAVPRGRAAWGRW